jgi:putative two-component system response regulator
MTEAENMMVPDLLQAAASGSPLYDMTLLILDDNEAQAFVIEGLLRRGGFHNVQVLTDSRDILDVITAAPPDLLLLDLHMPHHDGIETLEAIKNTVLPEHRFPVAVISAEAQTDKKTQALALGARDFIHKPFEINELLLRVKNLLETRYWYLTVQQQKQNLETLVVRRTAELEQAHIEMLTRLARVSEHRDDQLGEHVWRVAAVSAMLARELDLPDTYADLLLRAARLHDIGKVAIVDGILMKAGKLSPEEFEIIKKHTVIGAELLAGGGSALMQMAERIALTHHERWDGQGYPRGLSAHEIPLEGRIVAVADTFDTITHDRPYRRAQSAREALAEIEKHRGSQFDPSVVDACLRLFERGDLATGFLEAQRLTTEELRLG